MDYRQSNWPNSSLHWLGSRESREGGNVRGIIIARDCDDKLRYSLPKDPRVDVKTYEFDFKLRDPQLARR